MYALFSAVSQPSLRHQITPAFVIAFHARATPDTDYAIDADYSLATAATAITGCTDMPHYCTATQHTLLSASLATMAETVFSSLIERFLPHRPVVEYLQTFLHINDTATLHNS